MPMLQMLTAAYLQPSAITADDSLLLLPRQGPHSLVVVPRPCVVEDAHPITRKPDALPPLVFQAVYFDILSFMAVLWLMLKTESFLKGRHAVGKARSCFVHMLLDVCSSISY